MPRYIMKTSQTEASYVEWSTVVDAPVKWGPAEDFSDLIGERKSRCDETGTTMYDSAWGGWEDTGMIVHNMGNRHGFYWLDRDKLHEFLVALSDGSSEDPDHQQTVLDRLAKDITDEE
jgi:hypothetical protein